MRNRAPKKAPLTFLATLAVAGCMPPLPAPEEATPSNLTAGMVKIEVIKGETTQAHILEVFGSPNIVTMNGDGEEVWNYNRMAFESTSSSGGILGIFWTGAAAGAGATSRASSSAKTRSFDLILVFDGDDIVKDYTVISAVF